MTKIEKNGKTAYACKVQADGYQTILFEDMGRCGKYKTYDSAAKAEKALEKYFG